MQTRRYFIGAGLSAASAVVLTARWPRGGTGGDSASLAAFPAVFLAVFDPRFEGAEAVARQVAEGSMVSAIGVDATDLALWFQSRAFAGVPLHLQGVTPGSVPFCLRQLAPGASWTLRRLDRDLFVWSVRLPANVQARR